MFPYINHCSVLLPSSSRNFLIAVVIFVLINTARILGEMLTQQFPVKLRHPCLNCRLRTQVQEELLTAFPGTPRFQHVPIDFPKIRYPIGA